MTACQLFMQSIAVSWLVTAGKVSFCTCACCVCLLQLTASTLELVQLPFSKPLPNPSLQQCLTIASGVVASYNFAQKSIDSNLAHELLALTEFGLNRPPPTDTTSKPVAVVAPTPTVNASTSDPVHPAVDAFNGTADDAVAATAAAPNDTTSVPVVAAATTRKLLAATVGYTFAALGGE